jgi:RNA polymerase sigma-70 factor (ECF subfamily)
MSTESTCLEELIDDALHGDRSAFLLLYEHTAARVTAEASAFTASWEDANEIVSGVYEQAWRRMASYDPSLGSVSAWLCGIARTLAAARNRRGLVTASIGGGSPAHS